MGLPVPPSQGAGGTFPAFHQGRNGFWPLIPVLPKCCSVPGLEDSATGGLHYVDTGTAARGAAWS